MRERTIPAREVAELLLQLPQGCRVSKAVGGAWAWTDEVVAALNQTHTIRQIWHAYTQSNKKGPEPPQPPKGWLVEHQEAAQAAATFQRKAQAWRRDKAAAGRARETE